MFIVINALTSDGEAHHGREIYEIISHQKPEILTRNAAMYPFSAFSVVEFLFRDKFQFSRPYVAKNGVEIGRPAERLHDLIPHLLIDFKLAILEEDMKQTIQQLNLPEVIQNPQKAMEIMKHYKELTETLKELAKRAGDRVVLKA